MEKPYGQAAKKKREQKLKDQLQVAYDKRNGTTTDTEYANLQAKIIQLETELRSLDTIFTDQD